MELEWKRSGRDGRSDEPRLGRERWAGVRGSGRRTDWEEEAFVVCPTDLMVEGQLALVGRVHSRSNHSRLGLVDCPGGLSNILNKSVACGIFPISALATLIDPGKLIDPSHPVDAANRAAALCPPPPARCLLPTSLLATAASTNSPGRKPYNSTNKSFLASLPRCGLGVDVDSLRWLVFLPNLPRFPSLCCCCARAAAKAGSSRRELSKGKRSGWRRGWGGA